MMRKYNGIWMLIVIMTTLTLTACQKSGGQRTEENEVIRVEVKTIGESQMQTERIYVGSVESEVHIPLVFTLGGTLQDIYVQNGTHVRKGQKIARVDDATFRSMHEVSLATLRQAEDGYERLEKVHEAGGISDVRWVQMQTDLEKARQAELSARERLEHCLIEAPRDGVVTGINKIVGQTLRPEESIGKLIDPNHMIVAYSVPEKEIQFVRVGMHAKGLLCANEDMPMEVEVVDKSLTANPMGHTYQVKARVLTPGLDLLPGMVAKVQMESESAAGVILPSDCVRLLGTGHSVWVVADGKAAMRSVKIGDYVKNGVLIESGLEMGDQVVTSGYQKLYKGCNVEIID